MTDAIDADVVFGGDQSRKSLFQFGNLAIVQIAFENGILHAVTPVGKFVGDLGAGAVIDYVICDYG